jgi:hypothetical protein
LRPAFLILIFFTSGLYGTSWVVFPKSSPFYIPPVEVQAQGVFQSIFPEQKFTKGLLKSYPEYFANNSNHLNDYLYIHQFLFIGQNKELAISSNVKLFKTKSETSSMKAVDIIPPNHIAKIHQSEPLLSWFTPMSINSVLSSNTQYAVGKSIITEVSIYLGQERYIGSIKFYTRN